VCHIFVQFYTELSSGRKEALKLEWIQSAAATFVNVWKKIMS